jgi:hypothetical protein
VPVQSSGIDTASVPQPVIPASANFARDVAIDMGNVTSVPGSLPGSLANSLPNTLSLDAQTLAGTTSSANAYGSTFDVSGNQIASEPPSVVPLPPIVQTSYEQLARDTSAETYVVKQADMPAPSSFVQGPAEQSAMPVQASYVQSSDAGQYQAAAMEAQRYDNAGNWVAPTQPAPQAPAEVYQQGYVQQTVYETPAPAPPQVIYETPKPQPAPVQRSAPPPIPAIVPVPIAAPAPKGRLNQILSGMGQVSKPASSGAPTPPPSQPQAKPVEHAGPLHEQLAAADKRGSRQLTKAEQVQLLRDSGLNVNDDGELL